MFSIANRIEKSLFRSCYELRPAITIQLRYFRTDSRSPPSPSRRRPKFKPSSVLKKVDEDKSEWWIVDGEMHEIGDNVPRRERFVIARENIPNRRRKQLRDQFMRRTRLIIKESEHEPWCKRYMELYNELRENWERLYWDEGYTKKLARDHAKCDSSEDDDEDFNPNMRRQSFGEQYKGQGFARKQEVDGWQNVSQVRDKFEYDRERRMREKAFAPMNEGNNFNARGDDFRMRDSTSRNPRTEIDSRQNVSQIRDKFEYDRERRMREKAFEPMNEGNNFNARGDDFRMCDSTSRNPRTEVDSWQNVSQIRDKFEYDRERRMREKAFAPMNEGNDFNARGNDFITHDSTSRNPRTGGDEFRMHDSSSRNTPFDAKRYAFDSESE